MATVTQSIRNFLTAQRAKHNGPDLLDRYLSHDGMETQVNVHAAGGEQVDEGSNRRFTDGARTWGPIRIPKKANSVPEWYDYHLGWQLSECADALGASGWNWKTRTSEWVAYDIDGLTHGAGLSDGQLTEVRDAAFALPYVEVRRSTSGSGYHLYVTLKSIPTNNHTEHARLAQRVLRKMSHDAKFDFGSRLDVCGNIFWIWSRKATKENRGFELLKGATE
jgi:hypothetical protein